jgi:hypothetical protein
MRAIAAAALVVASALPAQAPGKWPPDSLVNVKVIPKTTSPTQVWGMMRNFEADLGVKCQFCHVGRENQPFEQVDFASDAKRNKAVARQMMLMTQEINRRIDTIPGHDASLQVTCRTCHRGLSRPTPLSAVMIAAGMAGGSDSALRAYRVLKQRFAGSDSYDFGEPALNSAAFRLGRAGKFEDALALLKFNEELFPGSSGMYVIRGNVLLMRADTTGAAAAFREAIRRDTTNDEAKGRLRTIGQRP